MTEDASFYRELIERSTVAVVLVGTDAVIRYHSREAGRLLTGRDADLVGALLPSLFAAASQQQVDGWLRRVAARETDAGTSLQATCGAAADGDDRVLAMTAVNLIESLPIGGIVLNLADQSELHRALALAQRDASFDALTGLFNRRALDEAGRKLFAEGSTRQALLAMLDVDNLKDLNDQHGHAVGDDAVRAAADDLTQKLGDIAMLARVGGDEFAALMPGISPATARPRLEAACRGFTVQLPYGTATVALTMSCGVASSTTATNWLGLLRRADAAVYEAKLVGSDRIYFHRGDEPNWEERRRREREALEAADRKLASLEADVVRLRHETRLDKRTGLLNAAAFEQDLQLQHQLATEHADPYSVVLCDIDFFHRYNERYLYQPANETLRRVADALKGACRSGDVVYRYGGEEMIVLLPRTELADARDLGERLRSRVAALLIPHDNRPDPKIVTVSVGVAVRQPGDVDTSRRIIDAANRALLVAKASGRNRVEASSCDQ